MGDIGISVPGAFKLDHLQPLKPILLRNFSNSFSFILGSQFLLAQRANIEIEKGEFLMRQMGSVPGPFAANKVDFIPPIISHF